MALDQKYLTCSKCGRTAPESTSFFAVDTENRRCVYCQVEFLELQIQEERERCAKIAEEIRDEVPPDQRGSFSARWVASTRIAERIRKQSEKRPDECPKCRTRCCVVERGPGKFWCDYCRADFTS